MKMYELIDRVLKTHKRSVVLSLILACCIALVAGLYVGQCTVRTDDPSLVVKAWASCSVLAIISMVLTKVAGTCFGVALTEQLRHDRG